MACGSGSVSIDSLSTAPRPPEEARSRLIGSGSGAQGSGSVTIGPLFTAPKGPEEAQSRRVRAGYLTGSHTPADVHRLLDNPPRHVPMPGTVRLPRAPMSARWGHRERTDDQLKQTYFSAGNRHTVEYFIGPDGNQTFEPERHIHVIHHEQTDKRKNWVELILTDRTVNGNSHQQHPIKETLLGNPSGQAVNDAIGALLTVMNDRPPGPNRETV